MQIAPTSTPCCLCLPRFLMVLSSMHGMMYLALHLSRHLPTLILPHLLSHIIIKKYAMPTVTFKPATKLPKSLITNPDDDPSSEPENESIPSSEETPTLPKSQFKDTVHENVIHLMHELLYVIELVQAVSDGDFGQVEDILPDPACIFHAAGSNNYSTKILHFLFSLKEVWTPEFVYVNLIAVPTNTNNFSEILCVTTCLSMFQAYQGML